MSGLVTRWLKPEEEELLRKREELRSIRAVLAERELELVDFRSQLAIFEGRYLRRVGILYAELDDWTARLSELNAKMSPSLAAHEKAKEARKQARQTYEDAHGAASRSPDFTPSPDLKSLFREIAKRVHPDLAKDEVDLKRRTRLMAEANDAYRAGDAEALHQILNEFHEGPDAVEGEGIGAELIRIIRQISMAKSRLKAIEHEIANLGQSEIAKLKRQAAQRAEEGADLLAELAMAVREQLERVKKEYEALSNECDCR